MTAAGIPADRIAFVGGVGSDQPLPRGDMGAREYDTASARVVVEARLVR